MGAYTDSIVAIRLWVRADPHDPLDQAADGGAVAVVGVHDEVLMFGQVVTVSVSIVFLLRCLIYEPSPRLRHVFDMTEVDEAHHLQIEAIKQVLYFNRVIVLTAVTSVLFFIMSVTVGIDAMLQGENS